MNKRQRKALEYRKKIIKSVSLELILNELLRRGLNVSVTAGDSINGIADACVVQKHTLP